MKDAVRAQTCGFKFDAAYPPPVGGRVAMARRRPSTVLPVLPRGTGGARRRRRRTGLPRGVSYTLSGKFQARIKLNGKRRDLGTFENEEDAAAAYAAAKTTGITGRAEPDPEPF